MSSDFLTPEILGIVIALGTVACFAILAIWVLDGRARTAARRAERLDREREQAEMRAQHVARDLAAAEARLERHELLLEEHDRLQREHLRLQTLLARTEADAAARADGAAKQIEAMRQMRESLQKDFQALAGETLRVNNVGFLQLANELFEKHRASMGAEGQQRETDMKALMAPIAETLKTYQERLTEIEQTRHAETHSLRHQIGGLQSETARLVNALRAAPKTRGRWGEETLKNVMELSGMSPFCDFLTEESFAVEDGRMRPDVIIRLPGARFLVVDAKTPMAAYLDAVEAVDEAEREAHLKRHAAQAREHMKKLADKRYHEVIRDGEKITPDFVVMFVPGENFFAAALERDPNLLQDAYERNVVVVTPTTLLALAKAISYGWRQEAIADNARHVAELGRVLYNRLATMGSHVQGLGKALESGVKKYNEFVGSLEGSVMPHARRFAELKVVREEGKLPALEPVRGELREPRSGEILSPPEDDDALALPLSEDRVN